jgi:hypothetical protein
VANKIIHRTGILKQVDVYDGQSHLTTSHLVFDQFTGRPLLTTVNNSFDNPVYSLNVPAHYSYDGMGAGARNYRAVFTGEIDGTHACADWLDITPDETAVLDFLKTNDFRTISMYPVIRY